MRSDRATRTALRELRRATSGAWAAMALGSVLVHAATAGPVFDVKTVHVGSGTGELSRGSLLCDIDGNGVVDLISTATTYGTTIDEVDTSVIASEGTGSEGELRRRVLSVATGHIGGFGGVCRPHGATRLVVGTNNGLTLYGGWPLEVQREFPITFGQVERVGIADVDGDGQDEIIEASFFGVYIRNAETGVEEARTTDMDSNRWTLAQLDSDPPLEFIYAGSPATQVDGATLAVEWSGSGIGMAHLALGNIDSDPAIEMVGINFQGTLAAYELRQSVPIWTVATQVDTSGLFVADTRDDGRDEIIIPGRGGMEIRDPGTHQVVASYLGSFGDYYYTGTVVGDLDGDGEREIAFQTNEGTSSEDKIQVIDGRDATHETRIVFEQGYSRGPLRSDFDANGSEEFLYAVKLQAHPASITSGGGFGIVDANSGAPRFATVLPNEFEYLPIRDYQVAQLDGDPAQEIVFPFSDQYWIYDGATRQREGITGVEGTDSPTMFEFAGPPGDPTARIYVGANGPRILLYDFRTGAIVFRSPVMTGNEVRFIGQYDLDGDNVPELVCGTGTGLWIWDQEEHVLERTLQGGRNGFAVIGSMGARLAVTADMDGHLSVLDFDTLGEIRRIDLEANVTAVHGVPGRDDVALAFTNKGVLLVNLTSSSVLARSRPLGHQIGSGNRVTVTPLGNSGGDAYRIAVGTTAAAFELTLSGFEVLFRDGFE